MKKTIKSYTKTYENIRKTTTIDLTKQQALDADPKAIQQINCTGNLDGNNNRLLYFFIEEVKEIVLDFSQETVKVLWMSSYD